MDTDTVVLQLAEKQCGAFSLQQARSAGLSGSAMHRRVRRGTWRPLHPGVFRATGAKPGWTQACAAAALWGGTGCAVAGLSAARLWGLDLPLSVLASNTIHLDIPNPWWRGAHLKRVEVFRRLNLTAADVTARVGIPCTTLERTLVDVAGLLGERALEIALDSARRRDGDLLARLAALLTRLGTRGRKGAGRLRRLVSERADLRQDSAIEVRLLRALLQAGRRPECNVPISNASGLHIATVDFLFRAAKLVVFTHGYAFHSDRPQWERDLAQGRALQRAGYRVLAFSAAEVRDRLPTCVADILAALR